MKAKVTLCLQLNGGMPQISFFNKKMKQAGKLKKKVRDAKTNEYDRSIYSAL